MSLEISGIDQVDEVLDRLKRLPEELDRIVQAKTAELSLRERSNNLWTQHLVGRHVAAITIPALNKGAWISVIEPRRGTSLGGTRTRFASQEAALKHSRDYAEQYAQGEVQKLLEAESDRLDKELQALIEAL